MPCAAPCNRLPCNQRCSEDLACGHQCPGLCGELCPEDYCQECSDHRDSRVDLLEMKSYSEIDLSETPIVVLGCGHFFTAETLDGHMGMAEVYKQDIQGEFTGLQDVSAVLALAVPRCPDCQCPVRQYCTQRFNRVINRAVIDEMSKRFLVNGKGELRGLERQILELEHDLEESQQEIMRSVGQAVTSLTGGVTPARALEVTQQLRIRHKNSRNIEKAIQSFCRKVADKNQPAQKLHDATVNAARRKSIDQLMADLSVTESFLAIPRDRRVTLGGCIAQLHAQCIILTDSLVVAQTLRTKCIGASIDMPGGSPSRLAKPFFQSCGAFIGKCNTESLPKLGVEASLYYARVARAYESYCSSAKTNVEQASDYIKSAKELLEQAKELCSQPFENADGLRRAVEELLKLLRRQWYEPVTADELAAIKNAMITGSKGIATHSGHWYNCASGHPVSSLDTSFSKDY